MRIVPIFAPSLFAFHLPNEDLNELKKVFVFWNDPVEMTKFLNENKADWPKQKNLNELRKELQSNGEKFEDILNDHAQVPNPKLDELFAPLLNSEYKTINLSKRKGKSDKRENYLRLYAIKIDSNCYVITGGAIKFTPFMEDRKHTHDELKKLERFRNYLNSKDVVDQETFFDLLIEEHDE